MIYALLDNQVHIQCPDGQAFRSGMDAVMLAAACPIRTGQSLCDLGCGTGAAMMCVAHLVKDVEIHGVEIMNDFVACAQNNVRSKDGVIHHSNIQDFTSDRRFDHIICNPPYLDSGAHMRSPNNLKSVAMGHDDTTLEDWIMCAHRNLKSKGYLTMIHRADQCDDIIACLHKRFGAVELIPLWPKAGEDAKRIIIRAIKDRKSPMTIHNGIVMHDTSGDYTPDADAILRGKKRLCL